MKENIFERKFKALGTDICIWIIAPEIEREKISFIFDEVEAVYKKKELIFSRFNLESELSGLNNNLAVFRNVSEDIFCLAKKALDYYYVSNKIFDPRVLDTLERIGYEKDFGSNPFDNVDDFSQEIFNKDLAADLIIEGNQIKFLKKMDFSGIAKGCITDQVANLIFSNGWRNFLVDSGGDMYASGLNVMGEKWGIAIEESENENETAVEVSNEGVATSGITRRFWNIGDKRFHHLVNPQDVKNFSFDLKSVTVIARTTQEADAMAKVLFLMGLEKGIQFANRNKIKSIFLKNNKKAIKSEILN